MKEDSGHDMGHVLRVLNHAIVIAATEDNVDLKIIIPAAILHDLVNTSKDNFETRAAASRHSAALAIKLLEQHVGNHINLNYDAIGHAIAAHSWSANIEPKTICAKIVQDADRLDSLGAVGIARLFSVGGSMRRKLFDYEEVLPITRQQDESKITLDHFWEKIIKIQGCMKTEKGKELAKVLTNRMFAFVNMLTDENNGLFPDG